jgi:hypothetical protein
MTLNLNSYFPDFPFLERKLGGVLHQRHPSRVWSFERLIDHPQERQVG